ncbi:glycosyltransferase family 2 protein [Candidatus Saccharibacteria bacterium]|nr:glycosyltransferase family 2 protein [Candidatus Saccharibacteria bacterium]
MKISLIIPVYNSADYLDTLIKSILAQSYKDYEVVFVNDGSEDNSLEILEEFKKEYPETDIKIISIKNSGPGVARRIGFEKSRGDLLFFVDSDDKLFNRDALARANELFEKDNFDILFFNVLLAGEKQDEVSNCLYDKDIKAGIYDVDCLKDRKVGSAAWYKMFRRELMRSEDFVDGANFEDCFVTYKYLERCQKFFFTTDIIYYANRKNCNSLTKKDNIPKIPATVDLLVRLYNETNLKSSVIIHIADYYLFARRRLDSQKISKGKKNQMLCKLRQLSKILKQQKGLVLRLDVKNKIKYIYYSIKDFVHAK